MKKVFALLFLLTPFYSAFSQYLPDGNFENWTLKSGTSPVNYSYYDPTDNFWGSLNELAQIPTYLGGPGPVTLDRTSYANNGTWAALLVSKKMTALNIFVPGMLATATLDIPNATVHLGRPYSYKPKKFIGYVKYEPVNDDSAQVFILLSKFNTGLKQRDTIAYAERFFKTTNSAYIMFELMLSYKDTITNPDSITILFVSSAGYDFSNLQQCKGQVNSTLYVDNLSILLPSGIKDPLLNQNKINVFPNPAKDLVHFTTSQPIKEGKILIYNSEGQIAATEEINSSQTEINTSGFTGGIYYYKVISGLKIISKGNIIIEGN
jgi:hypothetical protein